VLGSWLWAPCVAWPARSAVRYTGPCNAQTPNPIVVVGTRYDPNTSYPNAQITARRLGNTVLLTHEGYGHVTSPTQRMRTACDHELSHPVDRSSSRDRVPVGPSAVDPRFGEPLSGEPVQ
jgi:hypothetical protein